MWTDDYDDAPVESWAELNWNKSTHVAELYMQLKLGPGSHKKALSQPFTIVPAQPPNEILIIGWAWTENMTADNARAKIWL